MDESELADRVTLAALEKLRESLGACPEFWLLCDAVRRNPTDAEAVGVLADWIEENGGDPYRIRKLEIPKGSFLVLRHPQHISTQDYHEACNLAQLLAKLAGVQYVVIPENYDLKAANLVTIEVANQMVAEEREACADLCYERDSIASRELGEMILRRSQE